MSRTVSFRASEELDEFLKREAERRMTTKSTVAQMMVAERVRELQEASDEPAENERSDSQSERSDSEGEGGEDGEDDGEPAIFDRHRDKWYVPDTQEDHKYAVRLPEDAGSERKYYKTVEGAAERLREHYE